MGEIDEGCGRPAGRPRSEERHAAILDAAVAAFVEEGYDQMSIERVAARAGAGKATVYRRWRNKAELVVEAVKCRAAADFPLADTGDLRADLRSYLHAMVDALNSDDGPLMNTFFAARLRHPELQEAFNRMFVAGRRDHLRRLVESAVQRGDLPADADVELIADAGPAMLWHHYTMRGPVTHELADRIVDQFLVTP